MILYKTTYESKIQAENFERSMSPSGMWRRVGKNKKEVYIVGYTS
jgi:hypothetical protein